MSLLEIYPYRLVTFRISLVVIQELVRKCKLYPISQSFLETSHDMPRKGRNAFTLVNNNPDSLHWTLNIMIKSLVLSISFVLMMACGLQSFGAPGEPASQAPNILFIFADDWGWGDLGCHGHPSFETPHLDQLAAQGTDFQQFTVGSGVCSPSRTAIMTGRFPARFSINRHFATIAHHRRCNMPDWLDPDVPMLPRILKGAGYRTYHFGKWHLTNGAILDAPLPAAYGYDEAAIYNGPGEQVTHDGLFDKAIETIQRDSDEPFFINLWIHETHTPHYPKPELMKHYQDKGLSERDSVYAAVVTNADTQIGRVLKALDESGKAGNTLVIFSSDNGPEHAGKGKELNDPATGPGLGTYYSTGTTGGLRGQKRSLYEGGVRVPLFVRWPGKVKAGAIDQTSVITGVDWLPTLCAIAGAELPADYQPDGENRASVLLGTPSQRTKPIFWLWPGNTVGDNWPEASIRDGKWKLVIGDNGKTNQLYDIPADRAEANDVAEGNPQVVMALRAKLDAWLSELPMSPDAKCLSKLREQK